MPLLTDVSPKLSLRQYDNARGWASACLFSLKAVPGLEPHEFFAQLVLALAERELVGPEDIHEALEIHVSHLDREAEVVLDPAQAFLLIAAHITMLYASRGPSEDTATLTVKTLSMLFDIDPLRIATDIKADLDELEVQYKSAFNITEH